MTENEIKLISLINNAKDPEKALIKAIEIIIDFLSHPQSFQESSVACLQEHDQTNREVCVASQLEQVSPLE